jgi:hypothetical protein
MGVDEDEVGRVAESRALLLRVERADHKQARQSPGPVSNHLVIAVRRPDLQVRQIAGAEAPAYI